MWSPAASTVAAACNVSGQAFQLIIKVAEHVYMYSEISKYRQKFADGQLLFWTLPDQFSFIFAHEKTVWWTAYTFLFYNLQNVGMLLIGVDLSNKGLLIGENDV